MMDSNLKKGYQMPPEKITIEQVEELYQFLQGTCPEGIHVKHPPRLTKRKAFNVIWFLQEHLKVLPDNYEQCCSCEDLFDSWSEGGPYQDRSYCDNCLMRVRG